MQLKTFLGLFCTIVVLLIEANNGAVVVRKPMVIETTPAPTIIKERPMSRDGGRTSWSVKIHPKDKKLFNDYKKIISKKLYEVHKVPIKFNPKPIKYASQIAVGIVHHYLVKVPGNKYAYVQIASSPPNKVGLINEKNILIEPKLYALTDKNI